MKKTYTLHSDRLTLREIEARDAETIVALRSDPEVYRFFLQPHRITLEEHMNWYRSRYVSDTSRYDWVGEDNAGNTVGVFGAKRLSPSEAEVNYLLDRKYYGKGYAREAVEAVMEFCAEHWNACTAVVEIHRQNEKSIRFAGKLGFGEAEAHGDFLVLRRAVDSAERRRRTVYVRADANPSIGMGHLMRCLSLADAAEDRFVFVSADENAGAVAESRGYEAVVLHTDYTDLEAELPFWETVSPDLILVDSYFVTPAYLAALRKKARLVYMDDLCAFPYPADFVVNYNVYGQASAYDALYARSGIPGPRLLLGPAFAPLRRMFQQVPPKLQKGSVQNVLISTGGADAEHIALVLAEAAPARYVFHILVGPMNPDREKIRQTGGGHVVVHENVSEMRRLLEEMDIAVSAAGSTLYEICACGIPLITYAVADNQLPGTEAFERLGLAINLGDLRKEADPSGRILQAVERLSGDYGRRTEMGTRMQELIDGKGAARIWSEIGPV